MRAVVPLVVGLMVAAGPATVAGEPRLGGYNTRATHELTGQIGAPFVAVVVRDLPACDPRGDGPVGELAGEYVQFAVNDTQVFGPGTPEPTGASVHRAGKDSFVALVPAPAEGYARFRMRCRAADGGWNQLLDGRWLYVGHRNVATLQAELVSHDGRLAVIDLNLFGQRGVLDLAGVRARVDGVAATVGAGAATPAEPAAAAPAKNDSYVVDVPAGLAAGLHELRLTTATNEIVVPFIHMGGTGEAPAATAAAPPVSGAPTASGAAGDAPAAASAGEGGSSTGTLVVSLLASFIALAAGGYLLLRRRRSRS
jgi:hypothetical protein